MFGDRLKMLRSARKWTQEEVAKKLEISRGTYAHYEINKRQPDFETLKKLSNLYEVTIDYLLTGEDQQGATDEMWKEILDPQKQLFFKDLMDAPEEKIAELIKIWDIIKERDKK
ncbi:helix-turn-helix domain-containing protein [Mesobacillus zeae]|uniref:XRE family transcriptional regulator n=1 Tax=Mesobacillus zeae TaxID=1917180 RepID=A0A398BBN6_9BACI|nr:helix-turn-helix transcriptional regulator [Mesobacillus zeae]RID85053.1 XRE family transcriptional regulator [Mesobacillus zeae]